MSRQQRRNPVCATYTINHLVWHQTVSEQATVARWLPRGNSLPTLKGEYQCECELNAPSLENNAEKVEAKRLQNKSWQAQ